MTEFVQSWYYYGCYSKFHTSSQVTFRVTEVLTLAFLFSWQVKMAVLSSRVTGVTHSLLRPFWLPSISLTRAPFLHQTSSSSAWVAEPPSGRQVRETVFSSSVWTNPSILTAGSDWISTPWPWEGGWGENWVCLRKGWRRYNESLDCSKVLKKNESEEMSGMRVMGNLTGEGESHLMSGLHSRA